MSLNAVVYCDCVEKGRLTVPHPRADLLFINQTGAPDILSSNRRLIEAHDHWELLGPCQHDHFHLIEHWLGNVSLIGSIRDLITHFSSDPAGEYTVLWSKVIYDGSHTGDFLATESVRQLREELDRLQKKQNADTVLVEFLAKIEELVRASLRVNKPISF